MVQLVSYDGHFPNLCSGTLVLCIDGEKVTFPKYCLTSGGCAYIDEYGDENVTSGFWKVEVPSKYKDYREEIERIVNKYIPHGCCGGNGCLRICM